MTRDDIIRMAREAGLTESNHHSKILVRHSNGSWVDVEQVLTRFAALAADAEREACAKACENVAEEYRGTTWGKKAEKICDNCADAIRARGNP